MVLRKGRVWPVAMAFAVGVTASACQGKGSDPGSSPATAPSSSGSPSTRSAQGPGVFYDGFEHAADNGWRLGINDTADSKRQDSLTQIEQQPDGLIRRVTSPVRDGHYALRATVPHALGSFRAEIARQAVPMGSEYWYGFSIYLPPIWQVDPQDNILAQWHALIDETKQEGDGIKDNPPVALSVQGNKWMLKLHWNTQGNTATGQGSGTRTFTLGDINPGVWNDFALHAKWSHGNDGLVQLWQNGHQAVNCTGPDEYNDKQGPYFKIGIYHPEWKTINEAAYREDTAATKPIVIYDDAVRIAQAPATYQDVAPPGETSRG